MPVQKQIRPVWVYGLMAALLFQGISGIIGGIALVMDPTGGVLGLPVIWLAGSSFADFMIPGLILLLVLGVLPLAVLYGLWARTGWGWPGALFVGVALVIWIGVEIWTIGYHSKPPLQLIYGVLGIVLITITLLPSVRRFYQKQGSRWI